MALRETENNAYAKFLGDKQRALWYVMVFSGVVNTKILVEYPLVLIGQRIPQFTSWHTCARLCTRGVCTGSSKWRVSEKGKMRCNNDIKHVVKKLTIAISNRNIDELRELACYRC